MTGSLCYRRIFDWALPPQAAPADSRPAAPESIAPEAFRYARWARAAHSCAPYRLAQRYGWILRSPVEVGFDRIEEVQFSATAFEAERIVRELRLDCVVERDDVFIGIRTAMPLGLYDFRVGDRWEAMFLPNGERSLEWRLGLALEVPDGWGLLVGDDFGATSCLEVVPGILAGKQLAAMSANGGLSIAVRPQGECRVRRGEPVARILPVHLDGLRWDLVLEGASADSDRR